MLQLLNIVDDVGEDILKSMRLYRSKIESDPLEVVSSVTSWKLKEEFMDQLNKN